MIVDVGQVLTTGGLSTLLGIWVGRRGRIADASRTDAEADRIRTETYGVIVGDLRAEVDRFRAALAEAEERLTVARRHLASLTRWVELVRVMAIEAGIGDLPPLPTEGEEHG